VLYKDTEIIQQMRRTNRFRNVILKPNFIEKEFFRPFLKRIA